MMMMVTIVTAMKIMMMMMMMMMICFTHCEILEEQITPVVFHIEEEAKDEDKKHGADDDKKIFSFADEERFFC